MFSYGQTPRRWRRSHARRPHASSGGLPVPGLSFRDAPGPLVAVAGLCGGAGASTLAYLIAATAAVQSTAPVLVADAGGPTGGLAAYAGVRAPRTLAAVSERLAAGEALTGRLWAEGEHRLRVLANQPEFTVQGDREQIRRVLTDARAVHGLTVVDVGTLARAADQAALAVATHVVWVLPASMAGVLRAGGVLGRVAALSVPEVMVARAEPDVRRAPLRALADLADGRRAPLVMMPAVGDPAASTIGVLADRAQVTLQAIGGVLRR
jgi:MinD-like ATPase involved in chromosome partitioning or flagellar assembly